jgi:outer membrane protein, protease secretion system
MRLTHYRLGVHCLLAAFGALMVLPAQAIGLKQAYEAALKNDPAYRAAFYDALGGKEAIVAGRAGLLPNVSANYSGNRNRSDTQLFDASGHAGPPTHPNYFSRSASVSLRQTLFNLDALARYRQSKAQVAYSDAQFSVQGQELILRVTAAYIDALFASEQVALATAQRDTLLEQKKVNDRLFTGGEGTRTDMLETQARLDVAEAQLVETRDNLAANLTALSGIVGEEVTSVDALAPGFRLQPMPTGGVDGWKTIALARNPLLEAQQAAIEATRQEVSRNRAGHAPRLDMVASYSRNTSETINTLNQETTARSIGIQLTVPIYAGGAVNSATRQAAAALERSKADLQAKSDKVLLDVRKQYDIVQSSSLRIEALQKAVASGNLLVTATEQSIKGGIRINLDLLNAKQQLFASKRDLAQAYYNYLLALLRLRAAAGTLNADDVSQVATYFK